MHINVRDILVEDLGYNRTFAITGEEPTLESVILTQPLNGSVTIAKMEDGLQAKGEISTEIQLECHRCLSTFTRPVTVTFTQVFREEPQDDDMPITGDQIDLAPVVEQEIILSLPIKILDKPDCPGLKPDGIDDPGESFTNQARVKKGN